MTGDLAMATPRPPQFVYAITETPRTLWAASTLLFNNHLLPIHGADRPVMLLPGLGASERLMLPLRAHLRKHGFNAHLWGLGTNLGPRTAGPNLELLLERILAFTAEVAGQPISLIGWSLGGIMSRLIALRRPDLLRQIITLGSPADADPAWTNAGNLYKTLTGADEQDEVTRGFQEELKSPVTVPVTAIYSKTDGVVNWEGCLDSNPATHHIEVSGSHTSLAFNPTVYTPILHALDTPPVPYSACPPIDTSA